MYTGMFQRKKLRTGSMTTEPLSTKAVKYGEVELGVYGN